MANILLAAALLSGILAVSGCVGPYPGSGAYGYGGGGGYPSYGGAQAYPYDPGVGGGYAQPVQPYYQPQPYAYNNNTVVYDYQPGQPVQQATGGYASAPPGRWIDRRQQHQEERIRRGQASGQLTPREARRLQMEQGRIRGAEGRMRADGNLNPQERARLNAMQTRSSQDIYRQRHNGVQPGAAAQSRPTGPARPMAQVYPAGQPRAAAQPRAADQPRTAAQPRANGGRAARNDGGAP
jgi:hypothetical protein